MSILDPEPDGDERERAGDLTEAAEARRTRGGSSYQHSLSARGIKSSGRARSSSKEDLLSSMERLERATRLPRFEDEEEKGRRKRAYGRHPGGAGNRAEPAEDRERRVRGPHFDW